jgi:hypothetical protein
MENPLASDTSETGWQGRCEPDIGNRTATALPATSGPVSA